MKKIGIAVLCLTVCLFMAACNMNNDQKYLDIIADNMNSSHEDAVEKIEEIQKDIQDIEEKSEEVLSQMSAIEAMAEEISSEAEKSTNISIQEYIDSIQSELNAMNESESEIYLTLSARGNSMVCSYQYTVDIGNADFLKENLEQSISSVEENFRSALTQLRFFVPDAESLIVEYLDQNGEVLVSWEFR
jgi:chromosome segregation ATPase